MTTGSDVAVPEEPSEEPAVTATADDSGADAARAAMKASVRRGNPLSVRSLASQFALTRYAATELRRDVLAALNGGGSAEVTRLELEWARLAV